MCQTKRTLPSIQTLTLFLVPHFACEFVRCRVLRPLHRLLLDGDPDDEHGSESEHTMEAGDVGLVCAGDEHRIKNAGDGELTYFVISVGPPE